MSATAAVSPIKRQHLVMLEQHGAGPQGRTCGECQAFIQVRTRPRPNGGRIVEMGCRIYRRDADVQSRWAAKWQACGAFRGVS